MIAHYFGNTSAKMNIMRRQGARLVTRSTNFRLSMRFSSDQNKEPLQNLKEITKGFTNKSEEQQRDVEEKLRELEAQKPDLNSIYQFSMDSLSELPYFLSWFEPLVSAGKVIRIITRSF